FIFSHQLEDDEHPTPPLLIPERFFVFGEESVGVRVTPYHKPSAIRQILNALDTKETKLWPPSLPKRQVLIERITNDLSSKSVFTDKYGTLTTDQAVENAKRIEDGASAVQLYAKQCSKLILELLKKGHVAATRETLFEEESFDICKGQREAEESEGLVLNKGHVAAKR
ncbi:unnamed protein product, partial [Brassica oleracea]